MNMKQSLLCSLTREYPLPFWGWQHSQLKSTSWTDSGGTILGLWGEFPSHCTYSSWMVGFQVSPKSQYPKSHKRKKTWYQNVKNVWRRKQISTNHHFVYGSHVRLKGIRFLCKKLVATFLPKSPCCKLCASMIFTCACSGSSWLMVQVGQSSISNMEPTWKVCNHPNGSDEMRLMHPALKNIKVQYMKHDWASLQSSKITWKPCSVGIFLGYPTRPRGLRLAGWVFATRETLQILMASRVTVSNTPGAQKLLTLKTHQTIKHPNFCRLVVFFQLVGQKHPQVRCLTSRPMIFSHIYLPISKSGTP